MRKKILLGSNRFLDLGNGPLVMGILNCTPDSFYPESRVLDPKDAYDAGMMMIRDGADILDIGGESSRPGADYVSEEEELIRVIPVIEMIRSDSDIPISIDTRKTAVAKQACKAGADIINDISGLRDDISLKNFAAENNLPVIIMHMRGSAKDMQKNPSYENVVKEIKDELSVFIEDARNSGIKKQNIIIDPGIGFGKTFEDNLTILKNIRIFKKLGFPVLIGLSRKSFIGYILKNSDDELRVVEERLSASIAANVYAILKGADILRVHDVKQTVDAVKIIKAIEG